MSIADVFADAQKSSINHKSLAKRLCKIEAKHESNRIRFNEQIKQCVLRCLEVSKSEKAGANIVKFICMYCVASQTQDQDNEDEDCNNITSQVLITLLPHMNAKDKVIRYRATQIVSQLVGTVQEIEDELYQAIRYELILRIRDRVPAIRLEAVCALGRLLETEMDEEAQEKDIDEDEDDDDDSFMSDNVESSGLLRKLLDVLQNDTSPDVRRALLLNLPVQPKTLPYLLERARDKDGSTRRALYVKLMTKIGDFRHLTLAMREKLLRWGLRDRDERVRKAAARMFSTLWIEQIVDSLHNEEQAGGEVEAEDQPKKRVMGYYEPKMPALLELLERIDIVNTGDDDGAGLEAMKEFWSIRHDYFETVEFNDEFWADLSVESAFMARTFYDYCFQNPNALAEAEDNMPEVTRFGFHLQKYLNQVLRTREAFERGEDVEEEILIEQEFIAEQLLHIAHTLDYTDEIGRRKMFSLLRNMLSMAELPERITRLTVEALRLTCASDAAGEKEFIAIVVEAINEVHDTLNDNEEDQAEREFSVDDNESFVSAHSELSSTTDKTAKASGNHHKTSKKQLTPEEEEHGALLQLLTNLKCLSITQTLLQNIVTDTSKNMALENLVNDLIVPAIQSTDVPLRERGIECLGLACLLSPTLAKENRGLFVYCMRKGHEELRQICLKILCDITVTWHQPSNEQDVQAEEEYIVDLEPFCLAMGYSSEVQQVTTMCLAKLMMCGFYRGGENIAAFDEAIAEAEKGSTRGWELLAKVKAALATDVNGQAGALRAADEDERRQS